MQLDSASSLAAKPENLICEQAGAVGTVGITDLARGATTVPAIGLGPSTCNTHNKKRIATGDLRHKASKTLISHRKIYTKMPINGQISWKLQRWTDSFRRIKLSLQ